MENLFTDINPLVAILLFVVGSKAFDTATSSALAWYRGRRKDAADLKTTQTDNDQKGVDLYGDVIMKLQTITEKYTDLLATSVVDHRMRIELESKIQTITNDYEARFKKQRAEIEFLRRELKRLKKDLGKSK